VLVVFFFTILPRRKKKGTKRIIFVLLFESTKAMKMRKMNP
jgi:hypothetical protein